MSVSQMLRKAAKLSKDGKLEEAKAIYTDILAKFPKNQAARRAMAGTNPATKKGVPQAALSKLMAFYQAKQMREANEFGQALLTEFGDDHQVHNILGATMMETGNYVPAMGHFKKVTAMAPSYADGFNNLGAVMHKLRAPDQAIDAYEQAIALRPKFVGAHSNRNFELNYTSKYSNADVYKKHMEFDEQFGKVVKTKHAGVADPNKRLKIGYLSPDFYAHSVAYFFEPLLGAHDAKQVETYCYYCNNKADDTTARLKEKADHWCDVTAMDDAALAQKISADEIDILVDLAGHSAKSRIQVFARKPAPVQVAWLGYPNTTGLSAVDYRFTDKIADPVGVADEFHCEKLIRLDGGIWCYQGGGKNNIPRPVRDDDVVTFGSFNHMSKLSPSVIALWSSILKSVDKSRLILKHLQLGNAVTRDTVVKQFAANGIGADRLKLYGKMPKYEDHLALYGAIDVGLDPFPFNGCTTTFEALWMGVPVIALQGDRHVARVGASILTHVGHSELLAKTKDEYIAIACDLAADKNRRDMYRRGLRDAIVASPLGDAGGFAAKIEAAYREMWSKFARGAQSG